MGAGGAMRQVVGRVNRLTERTRDHCGDVRLGLALGGTSCDVHGIVVIRRHIDDRKHGDAPSPRPASPMPLPALPGGSAIRSARASPGCSAGLGAEQRPRRPARACSSWPERCCRCAARPRDLRSLPPSSNFTRQPRSRRGRAFSASSMRNFPATAPGSKRRSRVGPRAAMRLPPRCSTRRPNLPAII